MKIAAPHIANLFAYGSLLGIAESGLRQHLTNPELDVCTFDNRVTKEAFLGVFKAILQRSNNPNLGWDYGCYLNLKALGLIAELSLNCSSIEQAILFLKKYLDETFPLVYLKTKQEGSTYAIQLHSPIENDHVRGHLLDAVFCFMYRELKLMVPETYLLELQLPYAPTEAHLKSLDVGLTRGPVHSIYFDSEVLTAEINHRRIKQIDIILPKFMLMLTNQAADYGEFSRQVRAMTLNMCKPELPSFEQVAKLFPFSQRSIQRKLSQEGLSFRKIADDIKKEMAFYLSEGNKMKTLEIAYLLGYSEPSAYLHAVKRWKKQA